MIGILGVFAYTSDEFEPRSFRNYFLI